MRPAIAPDRRGRVFQYIGTLDRPAQIGVLTSDGRIVYDFRSNAVQIAGKWTPVSRLDTTGQQQFRRLVFEWERMRLAHAASQSRGINP